MPRNRHASGRALRLLAPIFCVWLALACPVGAAEDSRLALARKPAVPPTGSLPSPQGPLPGDAIYIGQTGHTLRGAFRVHWETHGGVARFGYPLSEEYEARGDDGVRRTTQLFDNARFELHREAAGSIRVALGQLEREALGGQTFPPVVPSPSATGYAFFAETGYSLTGEFLASWQAQGGLAFLGYPLSEPLSTAAGTVQHFERGRLEAAEGGAARLAAVGAELVGRQGWPLPARIALTLSPPTADQGTTVIAEIFADRPLTIVGARYDDRPLTFFGAGNYYRALIGIGPDHAVGAHRLTVDVRDGGPTGGARTVSAELRVGETDFPRDRIIVPPDQGGLLDPAVGARELALVAPLYGLFTPQARWSGPFLLPAQGPITTEFGERRAYNDGPFNSWHNGLDIGAAEGAPIVAPAPGRVVYTGTLAIRGNFTAIDHGLGILTCYFHQSAILVRVGQEVQAGEPIGRVGTTGLSTGAHLHWEVRVEGVPVSPWQWVRGAGVR